MSLSYFQGRSFMPVKIFLEHIIYSTAKMLKERMGKAMKKRMRGLLIIGMMTAVFLTGCSKNQLSDKFDEETVKEEAEKVVELFNERNYQGIIDRGDEKLKEGITAEQFAEVSDPYLDKCGEFQEIGKTVVLGSTDKETGMEYGGVVMVGNYEDGKIQFTIAFDEDMKLVQFLIK